MDLLLRYTGGSKYASRSGKKDYLTEIEIRKYSLKTVRVYDTDLDLFLRFYRDQAGAMMSNIKLHPSITPYSQCRRVFSALAGKEAGPEAIQKLDFDTMVGYH